MSTVDETIPGGKYYTSDGRCVDANGKSLSEEKAIVENVVAPEEKVVKAEKVITSAKQKVATPKNK